MTTIYTTHPRYTEHDQPGHPEHAGRIRAVWQRLDESGLASRMAAVEAKAVSPELILTVHTPAYLDLLRRVSAQERMMRLDNDTYAGFESLDIAQLSAGGAVDTVDGVLSG